MYSAFIKKFLASLTTESEFEKKSEINLQKKSYLITDS